MCQGEATLPGMGEATLTYDAEALALLRASRRGITRAEFIELSAAGAFEDEDVELLDGDIVVRERWETPQHAAVVDVLNAIFTPALIGRATVRVQGPFAASDRSQPKPDLALLPLGTYRHQLPTRVHLAVEVSWSTLAFDLRVKGPLYAAAEVEEYWALDVRNERALVHRHPSAGAWGEVTAHGMGNVLAPLAFPDVEVALTRLFGGGLA